MTITSAPGFRSARVNDPAATGAFAFRPQCAVFRVPAGSESHKVRPSRPVSKVGMADMLVAQRAKGRSILTIKSSLWHRLLVIKSSTRIGPEEYFVQPENRLPVFTLFPE
jgi:hypothetical protein